LKKLFAVSGQSPEKPNWHHFSIRERVDFLRRCDQDRSWIKRHDNKVRTSILLFTAALILVGIAGLQLNFGQTGKHLNEKFFETAIQNEISRNQGNNADLYGMLGDLYFERNDFKEAQKAYRTALKLEPDSAIILNNYAWLLATCEDDEIRNPETALAFAQKAATIEPSAHVMDTLAEALFINGKTAEAVDAAKTALESAKTNRSYYKRQLEKFQAASEE
jgi:tetratricopeptide (TPR) repeat protein